MGSTGNIGCQTLDVIRMDLSTGGQKYAVAALSTNSNLVSVTEQALEFKPLFIHIADRKAFRLAQEITSLTSFKLVTGEEGWLQILEEQPDLVVHSIFGRAGLKPLLLALEAGINVAFAGKEALISGGPVVLNAAESSGAKLLPVDSEHNSIFRCLAQCGQTEVSKLILTASGGPLRAAPDKRLQTISAAEAACHPTWNMGERISINSATLVNKGLEIVEASYLFRQPIRNIDVLLHPQSIVHGIVQLTDGSMLMHAAQPDMRLPIAFCLDYPKIQTRFEPLDLVSAIKLEFGVIDTNRFPALELFRTAAELGWIAPAILNIANEMWLDDFIAGNQHGILGCYTALEHALRLVPDYIKLEPTLNNWLQVETEIILRLRS